MQKKINNGASLSDNVVREEFVMNIDRINRLNKIAQPKKKGPVSKSGPARGRDTVSLSSEALRNAEIEKYKEIAKSSPDVRMDRVNELKAKINDPAYFNDESVLRSLTDNIADSLGI